MWSRKNKKSKETKVEKRDISIHEVRKAVHAFADSKPKEVPLSVVIKEDLTLDYKLLAPYLKAVPVQNFYMSRETYELFEEQDKDLALDIDLIQQAVDEYIEQTQELPIIDDDPYKRISYYKLERRDLLHRRPNRDFYLTNEEFMITYKKPR
ncbi:Protein of unknown function [Halobacillus karajensis]|uniref:DUF3939 domain-containing protein n=1 Tax=Halobacillus karajensis TaxID=195088 RepID=A0A024P8V9_9BACI|nr:DUF3939 domain-containing protein [Halobacillus karajensis]CDQ21084.1 hypothetical protein BN982_03447 [Halobacillus karajensis]CDQ24852.1 hypothetical protein BN983_03151 [Halobacillus karajensis]CDQ28788.1 hypothetical protein BN981_03103 [Halobacillus karajensis]SEH96388.1 Protein of unknown function [Halobacillus karajensis]